MQYHSCGYVMVKPYPKKCPKCGKKIEESTLQGETGKKQEPARMEQKSQNSIEQASILPGVPNTSPLNDIENMMKRWTDIANETDEIGRRENERTAREEAEKAEMERRENERKAREETEKVEKEQVNAIPNVLNLVRKFVINQFKDIEKILPNIKSDQADAFVRSQIQEKIPLFFDAMNALGYPFTEFQQKYLFEIISKESEPIRVDLVKLLRAKEEAERIEKEREELQRKLEEQKKKTIAAFGEEIVNVEVVDKVEQLKPVSESIDDLLKKYKEWETVPGIKKKQ